jgi:hypothetical protein
MNIDDKITKQLEDEASEIDRILANENKGLTSLLNAGLKGSMRPWFIVTNIIIAINFLALVYAIYSFFTQSPPEQLFWGILSVMSFQFHIAAKSWLFNEMSRSLLMRELKRLEVVIAESCQAAKEKS